MFVLPLWGTSAVYANYYTTVNASTTSHYKMALNGITGTGMVVSGASTVVSSYDAAIKWIDRAIEEYKERDKTNLNRQLLKKLGKLKANEEWKAAILFVVVGGGVMLYSFSSYGQIGKAAYLTSCLIMPIAIAAHRFIQQPRIENGSIKQKTISIIHQIFLDTDVADLRFVSEYLHLNPPTEIEPLLSKAVQRVEIVSHGEIDADALMMEVEAKRAAFSEENKASESSKTAGNSISTKGDTAITSPSMAAASSSTLIFSGSNFSSSQNTTSTTNESLSAVSKEALGSIREGVLIVEGTSVENAIQQTAAQSMLNQFPIHKMDEKQDQAPQLALGIKGELMDIARTRSSSVTVV